MMSSKTLWKREHYIRSVVLKAVVSCAFIDCSCISQAVSQQMITCVEQEIILVSEWRSHLINESRLFLNVQVTLKDLICLFLHLKI